MLHYKTMFENDISIEDKNNFKEYLRIYAYDLIHLDNSLLKNIETKLKKIYIKLMKIKKYFNQFLQNNQFILN